MKNKFVAFAFMLGFLLLAMASACTVVFGSSLSISVQEPQNKIYEEGIIPVVFSYTLPTYESNPWGAITVALGGFTYSLDGKPEGNLSPSINGDTCKTTISGLSEGNHTLIFYVHADLFGSTPFNWYNRITVRSHLIEFAVRDITEPKIQVLSIPVINPTFNDTSVPLVFSVNEVTSWMGYSVDDKTVVTISGNTTLMKLAEGSHSLTVYANDTWGNMGQSRAAYLRIAPQPTSTPSSTTTLSPSPSPTLESTLEPTQTSNPTVDDNQKEDFPLPVVLAVVVVIVLAVAVAALVYFRRRKP